MSNSALRVVHPDDPAPTSEVQTIEIRLGQVIDVVVPETTLTIRLRVEEHDGQLLLIYGVPES